MTDSKKIEDGGPGLSDLIERIEKAEASFDLECGIGAALEPQRGQAGLKPRAYLTSVDAAIALTSSTLPGWRYAVERRASGMCLAWVSEEDDAPCIPAMHRDTAIALVLATLRALQSKGSSNG